MGHGHQVVQCQFAVLRGSHQDACTAPDFSCILLSTKITGIIQLDKIIYVPTYILSELISNLHLTFLYLQIFYDWFFQPVLFVCCSCVQRGDHRLCWCCVVS